MLDLVRILIRWRRPLVGVSVLAAVVASVVVLNIEPRFYAQASILPPPDEPGFGGMSEILRQYRVAIPGGIRTPFLPKLYASIVSSRRMGAWILDEFDLHSDFGELNQEEKIQRLRNRTYLKHTDDGLFLVGYQDHDAKRAAQVANGYVRHLDELIQKFNSARAGQTRSFVEGQIERCNLDLARAEEALRDFQRQHHAIQIDTQTQGALQIAAELQGQILAAEIELDLLERRALPTAQEVRSKKHVLDALRSKYAELTGVDVGLQDMGSTEPGKQFFPRFDSVPDLALRYVRLLRNLKVQETLYTLLVQQLEQSRIEEQKNTPVLSVLDWAEPSSTPVFPQKTRTVLVATLAAFLWLAIVAVFVEKLRARRVDPAEEADRAALQEEWDRMPQWVRRLEKLVVK